MSDKFTVSWSVASCNVVDRYHIVWWTSTQVL